ncbi:hypothetical protein NKH77_49135 [Streptomyces sp. M19]
MLTTHDIAWAEDNGEARLSDNGQRLWDRLIRGNDQIFLALGGHYWPRGAPCSPTTPGTTSTSTSPTTRTATTAVPR